MSGAGFQQASDKASDYAAHQFAMRALLARVRTTILVQVVAVSNTGGLSPSGTVDIVPMVNQVDGAGQAVPHGTIHGCPYSRIQGGANAVILDPAVGDIGIACFADRDLSHVVATRAAANPGTMRMHDMTDALYIAACLTGTPTQYIRFDASGITLTSPQAVTIHAPTITLQGDVAATGTFSSNGHDISSTHRHTAVQTGSGTSGPPQ